MVEISLFTHDRPPIDRWDDAFDLNWISSIKTVDRQVSTVDGKSTVLFFLED